VSAVLLGNAENVARVARRPGGTVFGGGQPLQHAAGTRSQTLWRRAHELVVIGWSARVSVYAGEKKGGCGRSDERARQTTTTQCAADRIGLGMKLAFCLALVLTMDGQRKGPEGRWGAVGERRGRRRTGKGGRAEGPPKPESL
jgi:hypothetical protein